MNINDIILDLGATRITAPIPENCTDAELDSHLKANVQGVALTVKQVRDQVPILQAQIIAANEAAAALSELVLIDAASVRAMREYIASKADAPQILKDKEAAAILARAKLK